MTDETKLAFKKVSRTCIGAVEDACKDDLILIAKGLGYSAEETLAEFPEFYQREEDNLPDEYLEDQEEDQDEDEQLEEEEKEN